jgi:L-serine dehydratase
MSSSPPISVFDMLKIGVGPSSSHTLGPWRAAQAFVDRLRSRSDLPAVTSVEVDLLGSLAKTGRGHGTGIAIMMGLSGHDPVTCDVDIVQQLGPECLASGRLLLGGEHPVPFVRERDLHFLQTESLPAHPNGMRFTATLADGRVVTQTSYSIGGGFVEHEHQHDDGVDTGTSFGGVEAIAELPYPIDSASDLQRWADDSGGTIAEVVRANERSWRPDEQIDRDLLAIRDVMLECAFRGCRTHGTLPGGLDVTRRAARLHDDLIGPASAFESATDWFDAVRSAPAEFDDTVAWISCFALAINEENAAFGRVVTAPTNGAAGVIPAVMFHHLKHLDPDGPSGGDPDAEAIRFLLVAAEIGAIFKKGSTISAAMGGCQAEIGVSSAMAAAALTECRGGTVRQSLMAAEIAMEHHLGLTCDPIGGLVQVPCIERNAMGAMKAISASRLARASTPELARVSLDDVIDTMWQTAQDMHADYKETAEGGLATRIPVSVVEC